MDARRERARVDSCGRAFAGSQRWIQYYINWHSDFLNQAIVAAFPSLREFGGALEWVSPLESEEFQEYRDDEFLERLGAAEHADDLRRFWPHRGPCWDALARVRRRSNPGVLLVEAKSYPAEILSRGCQAGPASRARIERALAAAKTWLGAESNSDWLGPAYQCANRLAHVYFFREVVRMPAWLVNVCFIDDPHSPTTQAEWLPALRAVSATLGLPGVDPPFSASVFLEANERNL